MRFLWRRRTSRWGKIQRERPSVHQKKQGPHQYSGTDVVLFQGENGQWNKKICCIIIKVKSV